MGCDFRTDRETSRPGVLDRSLHHLSQTLQSGKVALSEGLRTARKKFEYPEHSVFAHDGHDHHGGYSQFATALTVHPGIALSIVATQRLPGAHTLAGKTGLGGKQSAQLRRV
jgi:hypothetical protein